MALVAEEKPNVKLVKLEDVSNTLYTYPIQEFKIVKAEDLPAISISNNPHEILNKDAIIFPEKFEDIKNPTKKQPTTTEDEPKIKNLGRREESEELQEQFDLFDEDEEEQSILIQKLRELVIRFEKLLASYLDPDIPTGRKQRKKFMEERELFRVSGYKDFINAIDLKVDALCSFERFNRDMFCQKMKRDRTKENTNWFKSKIKGALEGNFYSAQEVVNSVMQIVKEEEYMVPKRRIVTKLK